METVSRPPTANANAENSAASDENAECKVQNVGSVEFSFRCALCSIHSLLHSASSMLSLDETIVAIASGIGGAARGIVRISGKASADIVERCFRPSDPKLNLRELRSPQAVPGEIDFGKELLALDLKSTFEATRSSPHAPRPSPLPPLPADLFLWPTARSYTMQPLAELHTFGSPPLLNTVLKRLCAAGARLAQPGEFTLCAFLAGRIDLTQAEAVLGVIDAADRRELDSALEQLAGGLSWPLQTLRSDLLNLLADLEAGLDFGEEDIRFVATNELQRRLLAAAQHLDSLAKQLSRAARQANCQKLFSLAHPMSAKAVCSMPWLKTIARALVSPEPGTTRDYLAARIDAAGLPVLLLDTAGTDESLDLGPIDATAQQFAAAQHASADLRLLCIDATSSQNDSDQNQTPENTIVVLTKCDMVATNASASPPHPTGAKDTSIAYPHRTSSRTKSGLAELKTAVRTSLLTRTNETSAIGATARVFEGVRLARQNIDRATNLAAIGSGEELIAAELRNGLAELGKLVGAIYTDDLLDRIFSRFCIGK